MVKLFVTGDNHIGKKYDRYPAVKETLIRSRMESLQTMVRKAEEEGCRFFVVTGDLFDNINTVRLADVRQTAAHLASFNGTVLILPGNHDYYTGEEKVWQDFENALAETEHNVILLKEFREYAFETEEGDVIFYPAFCQSKHAKENNLGWIRDASLPEGPAIRIGVAHGAIEGITPDLKEEYFLMKESELEAIPMDAWLIGHTHIPYPDTLQTEEETAGYRIFNAGTHEQTDLHNRTEGLCFILSVEKTEKGSRVLARKFISGNVRFYDIPVSVRPDSAHALRDAVQAAVKGLGPRSVIRLTLQGSLKAEEYSEREKICQELLGDFLSYEINDHALSEEITIEKIRDTFNEKSFAAQFMERLMDEPAELQMAYQLLGKCRETE